MSDPILERLERNKDWRVRLHPLLEKPGERDPEEAPFTRDILKSKYKVYMRSRADTSNEILVQFVNVVERVSSNYILGDIVTAMALELTGTTELKLDNIFDLFTAHEDDYSEDPDKFHFPLQVLSGETPEEPVEPSPVTEEDSERLESYNKAMQSYRKQVAIKKAHNEIKPHLGGELSASARKLQYVLNSGDANTNIIVRKYIGAWCLTHLRCMEKPGDRMRRFFDKNFERVFVETYKMRCPFRMPTLGAEFYSNLFVAFRHSPISHHSARSLLIRLVAVALDIEENHLATHQLTFDALKKLVIDELYDARLPALTWVDTAARLAKMSFAGFLRGFVWKNTHESVETLRIFHIMYRMEAKQYSSLPEQTQRKYPRIDNPYYHIARLLDEEHFAFLGRAPNCLFILVCINICQSLDPSGYHKDYELPIDSVKGLSDITRENARKISDEYIKKMHSDTFCQKCSSRKRKRSD